MVPGGKLLQRKESSLMREWARHAWEDLEAGSYIVWVYCNPFSGRLWYND